jgi:hypothetical protein
MRVHIRARAGRATDPGTKPRSAAYGRYMGVAPLILTIATLSTGAAFAATAPRGEPATCGHQSTASFPKAANNLVVGPLVLVGARHYNAPDTIARVGGQKYPAVVLAGHRVTIELSRSATATSLLYADDHWDDSDGDRTVADGHRVVTFRSCASRDAESTYNGHKATFWSGFILTTEPRCLTLRIWVDDERTPRRARLPLGKHC